ncbi:hypothetical protein TNCV_2826121 [Trichonephila clavipes]|nr:hypothetical protein TNCV_2826121 [Trichonephila clavipes]
MACLVTSSSPVPLKTRRVGQRCTLNLSRAETSSRWLEAGQSQAEVISWLQGATKVISRLWNQFQTKGTVTRKVNQGRHRAMTSAQDLYMALSARRHSPKTAARDSSSTDFLHRLAFTPGLQSCVSF